MSRLLRLPSRRPQPSPQEAVNHFAGLFGMSAPKPKPKPARTRRWVAWPLATSVGPLALSSPVAAAFEAGGMPRTANALQWPLDVVLAPFDRPEGETIVQSVTTVATNRAAPLLRIGPPTGPFISGTALNVPRIGTVVAAYPYIDPVIAERYGCRAAKFYGPKPIEGDVHKVSALGLWSMRWQSKASTERICDHLASRILIAVFDEDITPPALLTDGHSLPVDFLNQAIAWDIIDRVPEVEQAAYVAAD